VHFIFFFWWLLSVIPFWQVWDMCLFCAGEGNKWPSFASADEKLKQSMREATSPLIGFCSLRSCFPATECCLPEPKCLVPFFWTEKTHGRLLDRKDAWSLKQRNICRTTGIEWVPFWSWIVDQQREHCCSNYRQTPQIC
jgi:hypothetical protein